MTGQESKNLMLCVLFQILNIIYNEILSMSVFFFLFLFYLQIEFFFNLIFQSFFTSSNRIGQNIEFVSSSQHFCHASPLSGFVQFVAQLRQFIIQLFISEGSVFFFLIFPSRSTLIFEFHNNDLLHFLKCALNTIGCFKSKLTKSLRSVDA